MSDIPRIQVVTGENQEQFAQQLNTASIPLTASEILALRRLLKLTEGADALAQNQGGGGGGGPPHDPGMEARVAALEDQAKKTNDGLHRMEVSICSTRVGGLPAQGLLDSLVGAYAAARGGADDGAYARV